MDDLVGTTVVPSASLTPKSILKKTTQHPAPAVPPNVNIPAPTTDQAARHLQTALTYAHQIQAQKAIELEILDHIEALSLLPDSSPASAADVETFKTGVVLFQPSDYSALLEERNVNGLCGYTLCANSPPPVNKNRPWLRPEAERRFCSLDCARKAMYVKAQLNETPAWERRGGLNTEIKLREDPHRQDGTELPIRAKSGASEVENSQLAQERGDVPSSQRPQLVSTDVVEKHPGSPSSQEKVLIESNQTGHDSIEGHVIPAGKYRSTKIITSGT